MATDVSLCMQAPAKESCVLCSVYFAIHKIHNYLYSTLVQIREALISKSQRIFFESKSIQYGMGWIELLVDTSLKWWHVGTRLIFHCTPTDIRVNFVWATRGPHVRVPFVQTRPDV